MPAQVLTPRAQASTRSPRRQRRLVVVLPQDYTLAWSTVRQLLVPHGYLDTLPVRAYPILPPGRFAGVRPRRERDLLDVGAADGIVVAAGGRLSRLDLRQAANRAYGVGRAQWWTWKRQVMRNRLPIRTWESFLAEHDEHPDRLSMAQARQRFESQPRVLAMLALDTHPVEEFRVDPYELEAFQAGELVYATLCWQRALVGDALLGPDGVLHAPATPALADRLHHLRDASALLHALRPDRAVVAVTTTMTPSDQVVRPLD
jgi:hypothetical protein